MGAKICLALNLIKEDPKEEGKEGNKKRKAWFFV